MDSRQMFMERMIANCAHVQLVFAFLQNNLSADTFTLPEVLSLGDFCFRVVFTHGMYGLSVSCPPDVSYPCFETALVSTKTGKVIYRPSIGYENIRRFDTIEEVLDEILQLGESA